MKHAKKAQRRLHMSAIGMARSSSNVLTALAQNADLAGATYLTNIAGTITAVVLCATLFYELVGPFITKLSLTKANEIPTTKK